MPSHAAAVQAASQGILATIFPSLTVGFAVQRSLLLLQNMG